MVGEVAVGEPAAPVVAGRVEPRERLVDRSAGAIGSALQASATKQLSPSLEQVAGLDPLDLDPEVEVAWSARSAGWPSAVVVAEWRSSAELPLGRDAPVVEARVAAELDRDLALDAGRRRGPARTRRRGRAAGGCAGRRCARRQGPIVSASATTSQPVLVAQVVSRMFVPGMVAARDRDGLARADAEPAGAAVEHRAEDARRVEARHAEPLDRAVGGDQGAGVAIGEEAVVGDRRESGRAGCMGRPRCDSNRRACGSRSQQTSAPGSPRRWSTSCAGAATSRSPTGRSPRASATTGPGRARRRRVTSPRAAPSRRSSAAGPGTGASIAANKVGGIRAALCADAATADGRAALERRQRARAQPARRPPRPSSPRSSTPGSAASRPPRPRTAPTSSTWPRSRPTSPEPVVVSPALSPGIRRA